MKFWWKNFEQKTIFFQNGKPVFSDINCCCITEEVSFLYYGGSGSGNDISRIDNLDVTTSLIYDDPDGFIVGITSKATQDYIYYSCSSSGRIKRIDSDGANPQTFFDDGGSTQCFGITNDDSYIYFSDQSGNLHRLDLDGTNHTTLSTGQSALGIHHYNSFIYIADENNQRISRVTTSGTGLTTLVNSADAGTPRDVYVDDNYIYWLDQKAASLVDIGRIKRSAHDGSGVTTLYGPIRTTFGTGNAGALCLWPAFNRIYFTWGQTLERIDLDGSNHVVSLTTGGFSLGGCHNCFEV